MAKLMRCTEPYHAGDHFVKLGDILAENDPRYVAMYCQPYDVEPEPETTKKASK